MQERRADDPRINKIQEDVAALEASINEINDKIAGEADDHDFIKNKVDDLTAQLNKIENCLIALKDDKGYRDAQIKQVVVSVDNLNQSITTINRVLDEYKTGPHAVVHDWAEAKMVQEEESHRLKKKVMESLITRFATVVMLGVIGVFLLGVHTYIQNTLNDEGTAQERSQPYEAIKN